MECKENIICKKQNIILKKNKEENTFSLNFKIINNNIVISNIINMNLFTLFHKLNEQVIEDAKILSTNNDNTNIQILYIFKQFGQELGIPKKFMKLDINQYTENGNIYFRSKTPTYIKSSDKNEIFQNNLKKCEEIKSNFSNLNITNINTHSADFEYLFNMDINEDLPIYMENLIGVLMKKIFINIKEFIEKIE
jgi:hypothetical protein|tara:strand:+ start:2561 stop:3142 length:582 start_codon:yes stop_codon:yes gene_type:complete